MNYLPEFPTCLRPFGPELIERISAASAHPILGTVRTSVRGEAFAFPRRIYCRPSPPAAAAQYAEYARMLNIELSQLDSKAAAGSVKAPACGGVIYEAPHSVDEKRLADSIQS